MNKNKILILLLVFLGIMNVMLLYLVLNKPGKGHRPPRDFIAEQLHFDTQQRNQFYDLNQVHHRKMEGIDDEILGLKKRLFLSIGGEGPTTREQDSIMARIGFLSGQRQAELYAYFIKIEALCKPDQKKKFKKIIGGALRQGPQEGGPPHRKGPPSPK